METEGLEELLGKAEQKVEKYYYNIYDDSARCDYLAEGLTLTHRLLRNLLIELDGMAEDYLVCQNCFTYHSKITELKRVEFLPNLYSAEAECISCKVSMGTMEISESDWVLCKECETYHLKGIVKKQLECACGNTIEVGNIL